MFYLKQFFIQAKMKMQWYLLKVIYPWKQSEGRGERQLMNKLYDGACRWTMTSAGAKGLKEKKTENGFRRMHFQF